MKKVLAILMILVFIFAVGYADKNDNKGKNDPKGTFEIETKIKKVKDDNGTLKIVIDTKDGELELHFDKALQKEFPGLKAGKKIKVRGIVINLFGIKVITPFYIEYGGKSKKFK